jgi:choline kinase
MNDKYEPWGNFYSLLVAEPHLTGRDVLLLDGDVILDAKILPRLIAAPGDALLATDPSATLDDDAMKVQMRSDQVRVAALSKQLDPTLCVGEYIGVTKLSAAAGHAVFRELAKCPAEHITHEYYEHAYHRLTVRDEVPFGIVDIHDCSVLEIDDQSDLQRAELALQRAS